MSEQKTEQKHTPGPWVRATYIIYASQSAKAEYPIHAKKRGLIAKAYRASDARLIAAAPELLGALRWLVDLLPDPELDSDPVQRSHVIKARAAIAKATGEQA